MPAKEYITNNVQGAWYNIEGLSQILPLVPQQLEDKHDYGEEHSVAHSDQREIAFRETDSDKAGLTRTHWFSRVQVIFLMVFQSVFS